VPLYIENKCVHASFSIRIRRLIHIGHIAAIGLTNLRLDYNIKQLMCCSSYTLPSSHSPFRVRQ